MKVYEYLDINRISIEDYENISWVLKDGFIDTYEVIDAFIEILEVMGCPDEIIDNMNVYDVKDFVNIYNKEIDVKNPKDSMTINGEEYNAVPMEEYQLKGRAISRVFKRLDDKDAASYILSEVFKAPQDEIKKLKYIDYAGYVLKVTHDIIDSSSQIIIEE